MSNTQVEKNKTFLVKKGIEHSVFIPTETGLKKSILDATQEVRTHFALLSFHDYAVQEQGPTSKVIKESYWKNYGLLLSNLYLLLFMVIRRLEWRWSTLWVF